MADDPRQIVDNSAAKARITEVAAEIASRESPYSDVPEGYHVIEDADGERLVRSPAVRKVQPDPRIEPLARALFAVSCPSWSWGRPSTVSHEAQHAYWRDKARTLLDTKLDAVDPLCALLADEDRAVEVIRDAIAKSDGGTLSSRYLKETSVAVLAALREVAGNG